MPRSGCSALHGVNPKQKEKWSKTYWWNCTCPYHMARKTVVGCFYLDFSVRNQSLLLTITRKFPWRNCVSYVSVNLSSCHYYLMFWMSFFRVMMGIENCKGLYNGFVDCNYLKKRAARVCPTLQGKKGKLSFLIFLVSAKCPNSS